ncbi:hypothetical protein SARC_05373 [Sphaeroforma arctica JP610]|uniref:Fe2OG dioxygenase domain-containing protein n=1 Tax=Sphaeroforma arctica JP610 TaxID=667725 RepID=A0A0L0G0E9_9EUKA|nr:hypothetical protein SARC_05373 [Sphaeroforma arctica JP610]KNC82334.1 hypothetical protein SARC_05373 [Sphaeroforma arctica JP610]|eukprot:XP_014156236.1 hypothetical protein SARC_05373 [Sphaeroforma arctica JP610]
MVETNQRSAWRGWFDNPVNNQAMRFGNLQSWASELGTNIRNLYVYVHGVCVQICGSLAVCLSVCDWSLRHNLLPDVVLERIPLFDQMIVNSYQIGDGIKAHVDLARFADGIAVVSLGCPCDMQFTRTLPATESDGPHTHTGRAEGQPSDPPRLHSHRVNGVPLGSVRQSLSDKQMSTDTTASIDDSTGACTSSGTESVVMRLCPGDLLILSEDARYTWAHGIDRVTEGHRISLTLRSVKTDSRTLTCPSE